MTRYEELQQQLLKSPQTWLITGVAGFIGSNLLEALLKLNQSVVGLDNFATGHQRNLDEVKSLVTAEQWSRFQFIEGDIRELADCQKACLGVTHVLHQAALGSVPRSLSDPIATNETNISGFLNMLVAARDANVQSFTYAASSSTYGDHPGLPKVEDKIGKPLSPYAVTKYVNELYASVFARSYGFLAVGLRYFNVFGRRQDPNGAYAAVIPKWMASIISNETVYINGDGLTSRDFCYIDNVVQANILAALAPKNIEIDHIYNVAVGDQTSLLDLFDLLQQNIKAHLPGTVLAPAVHRDFREGDVRHSLADISKAQNYLGYRPQYKIKEGLQRSAVWYIQRLAKA